jgi:hypothetical protein
MSLGLVLALLVLIIAMLVALGVVATLPVNAIWWLIAVLALAVIVSDVRIPWR